MQKKPIILISCIVVVVIAIVMLIIYLAKGGTTNPREIIKSNKVVIAPKVELSYYPTEDTEDDVTIYIDASMNDDSEIASITLPDGTTTAYKTGKTYIVQDNGDYKFTVTGANGESTTKNIVISNILKISANNPYVPKGFHHIEGTEVDTGYVIEDGVGNQYVWVPVETGKLSRTTETNEQYSEDDYTANGLYNSVAKYYGFYIARYEASKDNVKGLEIAKSVEKTIPWSNITYEDAYNASVNTGIAYDYIGVKTALINSYAWDTTLNWLNSSVTNYSSNLSYGNYSRIILETGSTKSDQINCVCDMAGNLREWTTEIYNINFDEEIEENEENEQQETEEDNSIKYRVVRGGSAAIEKIASSRIGEREDLVDTYWGFRIILYKE